MALSLNPKVIGTLADETGCIGPGKLIWHSDAWKDIFDKTPKEMAKLTVEDAKMIEQRLVFRRIHLCFGWAEVVGRLCILGMMA